MKKRCFLLWMLSTLIAMTSAPVSATSDIERDTPITMTVNDTFIKMDTRPYLYKGTTLVPIRFVSEAIGAQRVYWEKETDTAVIEHEEKTIRLPKGKKGGYVNGQFIPVEQGIQLFDDRVFVPVRFVSKNLGCSVEWIYDTYTVNIQKENITIPAELIGKRGYTDEEIYWLSRIIHAESQGEPMRGKIAVGNVVLNRMKSKDYPNTIYGVIFDRKHGVQFSPVLSGTIYHRPFGDSIIAAKRALEGENVVGNCLFFLNPVISQSFWIVDNRDYYTTIANF